MESTTRLLNSIGGKPLPRPKLVIPQLAQKREKKTYQSFHKIKFIHHMKMKTPMVSVVLHSIVVSVGVLAVLMIASSSSSSSSSAVVVAAARVATTTTTLSPQQKQQQHQQQTKPYNTHNTNNPKTKQVVETEEEEDAERGGTCVDADPSNCPFWAATGECSTNKEKMHTLCKKSCQRCNVVRVQTPGDIQRYIQAKQHELQAKRIRKQQNQEAIHVLSTLPPSLSSSSKQDEAEAIIPDTSSTISMTTTTRTIQEDFRSTDEDVGSSTTETSTSTSTSSLAEPASIVTTTAAATTESSTSSRKGITTTTTSSSTTTTTNVANPTTTATVSNEKNNNNLQPTMLQKKKKKKQPVTIDAETGLECMDHDDKNCPYWAATGECKKNRTWMHTNCKRSCERCHVVRVKNHNEMNQYISQKKKDAVQQREERKKQQHTIRILEGGSTSSVGNEL